MKKNEAEALVAKQKETRIGKVIREAGEVDVRRQGQITNQAVVISRFVSFLESTGQMEAFNEWVAAEEDGEEA